MFKSMIVSVLVSAVLGNLLHLFLLGWVNDGLRDTAVQPLGSVIFSDGQRGSPFVMMFYFVVTYLFWWFVGVVKQRGIGGALKQLVTTPGWIGSNLKKAGASAFPVIIGGLAVSFILGLTVIKPGASLSLMLMMFGVLASQEESLMVHGLYLGFNDISNIFNKGSEDGTDVSLPVMSLFGAFVGFAWMSFLTTNPLYIGGLLAITVVGLGVMFVRGRRSRTLNSVLLLFFVLSVVSFIVPHVTADDGGIREGGGLMYTLQNSPSIYAALIQRGYSASLAASFAAILARASPEFKKEFLSGKLKRRRKGESTQDLVARQQIFKAARHNIRRTQQYYLFGKGQKLWLEGGGDIMSSSDALMDQLKGGTLDLSKLGQLNKITRGNIQGKYLLQSEIPSWSTQTKDMMVNWGSLNVREALLNVDADGNASYSSILLRMGLGIGSTVLTGTPLTEFVYEPGGFILRVKDKMESGASERDALMHAGKIFARDEAIGQVLGPVLQIGGFLGKHGGRVFADLFPEAAEIIVKDLTRLTKPVVKTLNTNVGDLVPWKSSKEGLPTLPGLKRNIQVKSTEELWDDVNRMRKGKQQAPGIDEYSFDKASGPADLRGLPNSHRKIIEQTADDYGVDIITRPTTEHAEHWQRTGRVKPKPLELKPKTISDVDTKLGFNRNVVDPSAPQGNRGLVACKEPELPRLQDCADQGEYDKALTRYFDRLDEYKANKPQLDKMVNEGKITWNKDNGIIQDAKTGEMFTGDTDFAGIRDARTKKPVSPIMEDKIMKRLQQKGAAEHSGFTGFNTKRYANGNRATEKLYKDIDSGTLNKHHVNNPNGENLNVYSPADKSWESARYNGPTQRTFKNPDSYTPQINVPKVRARYGVK